MVTLVLGCGGFTGRAFVNANLHDDETFFSDIHPTSSLPRYYSCDCCDPRAVFHLLTTVRPKRIYNFLGSFSNNYEQDYAINTLATKNVFDALCSLDDFSPRILLLGSAAEYGFVMPDENPIAETHALHASSIYGLTKIYQTHLMELYVARFGIDAVMARPFNLYGKGASLNLFIGRLFEQVTAYHKNKSSITLGDLNAKRDYIDVHDAVICYKLIMESGATGNVYNVGSGSSVTMRSIVERVFVENGIPLSSLVCDTDVQSAGGTSLSDIYADVTKIAGLRGN